MRSSAFEPPKFCSLPPISKAFTQNAHEPADHGWKYSERSSMVIETIVSVDMLMAPEEFLSVIKCRFNSLSPCSTNRGGYSTQGLTCTSLYVQRWLVILAITKLDNLLIQLFYSLEH